MCRVTAKMATTNDLVKQTKLSFKRVRKMAHAFQFLEINPAARTLTPITLYAEDVHAPTKNPNANEEFALAAMIGTVEVVSPLAHIAAARAFAKHAQHVDVHQVAIFGDGTRLVIFCRGDVQRAEIASLMGFAMHKSQHPFFDTCYAGVFPPKPNLPRRRELSNADISRIATDYGADFSPLSDPFDRLARSGIELSWTRGDAYDASKWLDYATKSPVAFRRLGDRGILPVAERVGFLCVACGRDAPKKCARCNVARYCGRECQQQHWTVHKSVCTNQKRPSGVSKGAARSL